MDIETEVLVVGAGPVGLALAIELGMRGIRALVVERNIRGGNAPRAKTTNARTRAHLRRWGIADKMAQASPLGVNYPNDVMFTTGLSGHRFAHFRNAFNAAPERSPLYPEHAQWVPQYTLEKVMAAHARTLPAVEFRFDTKFLSASQDGDTVRSELQSGAGDTLRVSSRYMVGADGARSLVRDLIGAKMEGRQGLSRSVNIVFRAPGLAQAHSLGQGVMYWQIQKDRMSLVGPMDTPDIWFFGGPRLGESMSHAEIAALIAQTTGVDLPYEILSTDHWVASELLADHYSQGRIILAGDACHLHPPFGGYGMNMGIGDGVDLGWKLAASLQGWGGPGLIDSYEAERRPVHRAVIEEAVANHAFLIKPIWRDGLDDDTAEGDALRHAVGEQVLADKAREFHTLGTVLGLGYVGSPIIAGEAGLEPVRDGQVYVPTARPGYLAPHAWLPDGRSLYDAFGNGFALVVAEGADEGEIDKAVREAVELGVPLEVVRAPGVPINLLYEAELTLVRPDQHVAWRGSVWDSRLDLAVGLR